MLYASSNRISKNVKRFYHKYYCFEQNAIVFEFTVVQVQVRNPKGVGTSAVLVQDQLMVYMNPPPTPPCGEDNSKF